MKSKKSTEKDRRSGSEENLQLDRNIKRELERVWHQVKQAVFFLRGAIDRQKKADDFSECAGFGTVGGERNRIEKKDHPKRGEGFSYEN